MDPITSTAEEVKLPVSYKGLCKDPERKCNSEAEEVFPMRSGFGSTAETISA